MIRGRSPILAVAVRAATPLALLVGAYLLFAGHNQPGGGFAAGLVVGAVVSLRTIAGIQRPAHASALIASGVGLICLVAALPMLWGSAFLDQRVVSATLPVLGTVKTGTALPFDIGVTAVVVGMIIALLDGLGATDLADETPRRAAVPVVDHE